MDTTKSIVVATLTAGMVIACGAKPTNAKQAGDAGESNDVDTVDSPGAASTELSTDTNTASLCDGSDDVILAHFAAPQLGRQFGAAVGVELGAGFLYVIGTCDFWVWQALEPGPFRRGHLTEQDMVEMLADLRYDSWSQLEGRWGSGGADTPDHVMYSRTTGLVCNGGCPSAPVEAQEAYRAAINWRATLWERGEPMHGSAVRVAPFARRDEDPTLRFDQTAIPWPFNFDAQTLSQWLGAADTAGTSRVVSDEAAIIAINDAREAAIARQRSPSSLWFGPFENFYYGFTAREVLPFEDEHGLIAPPAFVSTWTERTVAP